MSLVAVAASVALAAIGQPVHNVDLEHRGGVYRVTYRTLVETQVRTVGMAAGPRPSTQRCVVSALVSVERIIARGAGGHELKTILPGREHFTQHLPGNCSSGDDRVEKLLASNAPAVSAHLSQVAVKDRDAALAAIDTAHHFATN